MNNKAQENHIISALRPVAIAGMVIFAAWAVIAIVALTAVIAWTVL